MDQSSILAYQRRSSFSAGPAGGEIYHDLNLIKLEENQDDPHNVYNGIGLRILCQNLVTLDFPNRILYLKRNSDWALVDKKEAAAARIVARSALKFLEQLREERQLPGMYAFDYGKGTSFYFNHASAPYLDTITWSIRINDYSLLYHYSVTRTSKEGPWKLQKAWRTDRHDHTVKEYPIAP